MSLILTTPYFLISEQNLEPTLRKVCLNVAKVFYEANLRTRQLASLKDEKDKALGIDQIQKEAPCIHLPLLFSFEAIECLSGPFNALRWDSAISKRRSDYSDCSKHGSKSSKSKKQPDTAGGVYTKEAEEADCVADDFVVVQIAALAEEDYDRAAAEKFS
ncbi:hypothetical protein KIN20_007495, partial [Parelaphostrongylus tenuis]